MTARRPCISVEEGPIIVAAVASSSKCILWSFFYIPVFLFYFHLFVFDVRLR